MFVDVVHHGGVPALEKMLAFTEARHRVLTENIANVDTPGYVTRQLDPRMFQRALRKAIDASRESGDPVLHVESTRQFRTTADGSLEVTPVAEPAENVLFHDGTNGQIERQMAMLAENAMMHQTVTELLRSRFESMVSAIRGTVR